MTNRFTAEMEALDRKAGRVHTLDDWRRVGAKAEHAPATLTDDDILILAYFAGQPAAERATIRRAKALEPTALPATEPAPVATTSAGTQADDLLKYFDAFGDEVIDILKKALTVRDARITALESDVTALKAQPFLKDGGTWRNGAVYAVGDVAQFKGTRWVCTKPHTASGNPDHSCFQLWAKTGTERDAR